MIYNKAEVRRPLRKRDVNLAKQHDPCALSTESEETLRALTKTRKHGLAGLEHLTAVIANHFDRRGSLIGLNGVPEVLKARRGHCIQRNLVLRAACLLQGIKTGWIISKNPQGYNAHIFEDVGVHPFVTYTDDSRQFLADAVTGEVVPAKHQRMMGRQYLCQTELTAFYLADGAEDLSDRGMHSEALPLLNLAQKIDPNNYVIRINQAVAYEGLNDIIRAEQEYRAAIALAPACADPHEEYAAFCSRVKGAHETHRELLKAASKQTRDLQVIYRVYEGLRDLGAQTEASLVVLLMITIAKEQRLMQYCGQELASLIKESDFEKNFNDMVLERNYD